MPSPQLPHALPRAATGGTQRSGKADVHPDDRTPRRARRGTRLAVVAGLVALATTGCSAEQLRTGYMPSEPGITDDTARIINLWNGSWIAALVVGAITWGLIIWCMAAYRRRKTDTGLPVQMRYHLPLEMMYTIIPLFMIAVLFAFTARDQAIITAEDGEVDETIEVVGKRWAWDFNYLDEDVYETSQQVGDPGSTTQEELPTLYLPVGETIRLELESRDVIHSFWVPAFLYKEDMIPGRQNAYVFTPEVEGTYTGKCAELCGEYHSEMLFQVEVVSRDRYEEEMAALEERGQTGSLDVDLGRSDNFERRLDEGSGSEG
jgi:cytochrome c oxidase subunit 2